MPEPAGGCCAGPASGATDPEEVAYDGRMEDPFMPGSSGRNQYSPATKKMRKDTQAYADTPFHWDSETCGFCCMFFCYLSVIPFLFIFAYHAFPTTIVSFVFICAMFGYIPMSYNQGSVVVSEPVGPLLSSSMVAATLIVFLGSMYTYWAHVQPMRALALSREYTGVFPQLPSVAFSDAAFVSFVGNTTVNAKQSVSMKTLDAGWSTLCVAPIGNAESTGRVEFWAVGVDCCDEDGKFDCGDAGDPDAKNGYVMQDPTDALFSAFGKYIAPPIIRRDLYLQAIAKVEQTRGLTTAENPLLVRWTKQTKEETIKHEAIAITIQCLLNVAGSAIMAMFLTKLTHRFEVLRMKNRMLVSGQAGNGRMDVSARLHEFLGHIDQHVDHASGHLKRLDLNKLKPAVSWKDMCITSILVPYIVMMLCVLLTSYTGCIRNGYLVYAPFYVVLSLVIMAFLATPGRALNGMFLMLVSVVGLYIGWENFTHNTFHYCGIEDRRSYSNVSADAGSDLYWDAGKLKFGTNAYLSHKHSVGFLFKDVKYCAAPILSYDSSDCVEVPSSKQLPPADPAAAPSPAPATSFLQRTSRMHTSIDTDDDDLDSFPTMSMAAAAPVSCKKKPAVPTRVDFWAIGKNCCDHRGEFRCDGGKDDDAHSAILVRPTGYEEPGDERNQFNNAIDQAVAHYGLPAPERRALIRWGKEADKLQSEYYTTALGIVLLTAMMSLLALIVTGFGSYFYMKKMRKAQVEEDKAIEREAQDADERAAASAGGGGGFFQKARDQLRV